MNSQFTHITIFFFVLFQSSLAIPYNAQNLLQPDFLNSMDSWLPYRKFNKIAALNDGYTSKAIELYKAFWGNNIHLSNEPLIPKIIHQIWLGSPFPEKYKAFQQSWKDKHPDWTYILWTEKEIEDFGLINKKIFDKTKNYGQKSDIARYEILLRFGGLYVDTDFECLKPCDILHHCLDFYTSCLPVSNGSLYNALLNGLIAARPGHPILKACVEGLKNLQEINSFQKDDIIARTGPHYFTKVVFKTLSSSCGRVIIFPASFFYPLPNYFANHNISQSEAKKLFVRPESFTIHWWACSWKNLEIPD